MATRGTINLCSYMLPDAGNIQESEVAALNRRNAARGRPQVSPIYTQADAMATLQSFTPVDYEKWVDVIPGVRARYWNAGHLLGSASIEIEIADEDSQKPLRILASGDIGPDAKLLQPDPEAPEGFDYVISESTYGDRERAPITADARRAHLSRVFQPLLDDIYNLSAAALTRVDGTHRRRLAPEAVVRLDWHNDMSKLVLDINERIEAAADDRARGGIIRKLRLALAE